MRKGAQQEAAIVAASRTGRCLQTAFVLEQDGPAPATFESQHRSMHPRPTLKSNPGPAGCVSHGHCQSDSDLDFKLEFEKKFPQSNLKKAAEQKAANQKQQKEAEKFSDQCLLDAYQCAQITGPRKESRGGAGG